MSTKIQWCDETLNPIIGCSKISDGCINCYAEKRALRIAHIELLNNKDFYYAKVVDTGNLCWNNNVIFKEEVLYKPFHWKKSRMIFINSMSDTFHKKVSFEWIDKIMIMVKGNQNHVFIMLTKRPEIRREYFKNRKDKEILKNLWLGVTVENQKYADKRIPILLNIPATLHFISAEPIMGNILLKETWLKKIGWVICGGMSGTNKYFPLPEWIENLQQQCEMNNIPFLFKQWGGISSHKNGRRLNGVVYNEFPELY